MYPSEDSAAAVFYKDGSISVNISAEKINLRNFWSGEMHSSWVIALASGDIISISGDIKVNNLLFLFYSRRSGIGVKNAFPAQSILINYR